MTLAEQEKRVAYCRDCGNSLTLHEIDSEGRVTWRCTTTGCINFERLTVITRKHLEKQLVKEAIVHHRYSEGNRPYSGILHDPKTDLELDKSFIDEFLEDLPDRTPIKVIIEVGKPRLDLPRWILLEPHFYGPESGKVPWPKSREWYSDACLDGEHEKCDGKASYARDLAYRHGRGSCKCEHHQGESK